MLQFNMLPKITFLLFFLLPLVFCTPPAPTRSDENATEFIRARCGATRYTDLCFSSLSGYAAAVQRSPVTLARIATNVTLARVRSLRAHVSALRRRVSGREAAASGALRDCEDELGDAADQVSQTAAELEGLESVEGTKAAWRVSNAQTYMSAALTNEDTCSDGFQDVKGGGTSAVEADVRRRVEKVTKYTSNALALVNSLVDRRRR